MQSQKKYLLVPRLLLNFSDVRISFFYIFFFSQFLSLASHTVILNFRILFSFVFSLTFSLKIIRMDMIFIAERSLLYYSVQSTSCRTQNQKPRIYIQLLLRLSQQELFSIGNIFTINNIKLGKLVPIGQHLSKLYIYSCMHICNKCHSETLTWQIRK